MASTTTSPSLRYAVPGVPVPSLAAFHREPGHVPALPSLLDGAQVRMVTSGRIAIGLALRALNVGVGDVVLLPAYHSPSMVPPVHWRGAEAIFYRVHPDATVDLDDIAAKLAQHRVKAIMATHYFGILQDLAPLRALCDRHAIGLVEDCAHCFFGEHDGVAVGSSGDYAIGSSMKFFPIYEGGCLVSRRHTLDAPLRSAGPGFEAKAALNALEAGFAYGRMRVLCAVLSLPLQAKTWAWNALKSRARKQGASPEGAPGLAPSSSDSSFHFDPRWIDKRSSWFSRMMIRLAPRSRIVARRRRHYLALQQALDGMPGWKPLVAALPDGTCPWVFPLLAERPEALFETLHAAGVPMVRFGAVLWPGVDAATCPNSIELGRTLIAFPCHQELGSAELDWMSATIRAALATTAATAVTAAVPG